ncbi:hypothetical protein HML84_00810 [Alcanivorax sp. IO_7]|nr:hypothetical protein HML84_00810 [Alcanivorax sp. IO_7]
MRLLIDANSMVMRTGRTHLSGIGRTSLELAKAFDDLNDPDVDIRLFTQTFRGRIPASFEKLAVRNIPWPIGPRYEWLIQRFPVIETLAPYDVLYEPSNFAALYRPDKTVVTIHDVMFLAIQRHFLATTGQGCMHRNSLKVLEVLSLRLTRRKMISCILWACPKRRSVWFHGA